MLRGLRERRGVRLLAVLAERLVVVQLLQRGALLLPAKMRRVNIRQGLGLRTRMPCTCMYILLSNYCTLLLPVRTEEVLSKMFTTQHARVYSCYTTIPFRSR